MTNPNPYASPSLPASNASPVTANDDPSSPGYFDPIVPPTNVRYGVLAFAVSMSLLLYLHRFALSVAMPPIKEELGLTATQLGLATGAFFYVYALAQVLAGRVFDGLGARFTLSLYVICWSLAIGSMGFITGIASLFVFRCLLGFAQAGAYPCIASVNKRWFPVFRRGMANSLTTTGGRTGGMLATIVTPLLMAAVGLMLGFQTGQWRWVFGLYALLGFVWAAGFWWYFRESPDEHPSCNEAERRLVRGDHPPAPPAQSGIPIPPFAAMATSPTMWLLCGIGICVNIGWIFLVTFLPTFLKSGHGYSLSQVGVLAAIPGMASMAGGVSGGLTTDFLVRRLGLAWGRRLPGVIASLGAACAYLGCLVTDHPVLLVVLFAAAGFLIDFGLGSLWAVYQDIAGTHVASVLGFANMCGNLAAGLFAWVIGMIAEEKNWSLVFLLSAGALVLTGTCWLFVDPRRKLA